MKYIEFPYNNRVKIVKGRNDVYYFCNNNRVWVKSNLDSILLNLANYYNINITKFAKYCYEKFGGDN